MENLNTLRTIATAYNTLDATLFEDLLADNFIYESQSVIAPMTGKKTFMNYIKEKFHAVHQSGNNCYAEIGFIGMQDQMDSKVKLMLDENNPCLIISQGSKINKGALLFIEKKEGKVIRMDMCTSIPDCSLARGTSEYPGLAE